MVDPVMVTAWVTALTPIVGPVLTTFLAILTAVALKRLNQIHVAVNSKYGAALDINARALRRIADLTQNPADNVEAVAAQKLVDDHQHDVVVEKS